MHYIYIHTCALAMQWRKPKNSALLSTSTHKNDDSKGLFFVHCLVPVRRATMITKVLVPVWIDAAVLLAVIIVTFIIQVLTSVTMIATRVVIIRI